MNIDDIVYGNPVNNHFKFLQTVSYADKFLDQLIEFHPPLNSSDVVKDELNTLTENVAALNEHPEILKKYRMYDANIFKSIEDIFKECGITDDLGPVIDSILEDIVPVIYKVKYHFNRPRPFQLAKYYQLSLFPYKTISGDSPSFPSASAYVADIILEVVGNYYPESYQSLREYAQEIADSRVYMGLNYQSDIDVALFASNLVKTDKEFIKKYKL